MHVSFNIFRISPRNQIAILSGLSVTLVLMTITLYDFTEYLTDLKNGNISALAILVSIIGLIFVLMQKLGLNFGYREEVELLEDRAR
jgi:hypothetical protein